jgi:DNA (cytosine-5)-methyltransferase 1
MTTTTQEYQHDTTLKLGANRGNPRVWIEGNHLLRAGFTPQSKFRATFQPGSIVLELAEDGDRTVSGRSRDGKELPIIDINAAQIGEVMGVDTSRIAVKIRHHRIDITPSRIAGRIAARVLTAVAVGAFVGGGLLSEAARAAGFETVAANEISESFAEVHERNHGGHTLNSCISEVDFEAIAKQHGPIGLFHCGIPCEPFSVIRRNAGNNVKVDKALAPEAHELGDMTFWALRSVDILNPHTVLIEETPKWLESGAGWIARHALERMGYTVDARIIDASELGAITSRKRAYMVATTYPQVRWPEPSKSERRMIDVLLDPDDERCEWFTRETPSKRWLFDHWEKQTEKGNGFASQLIHYEDERVGTIKKCYFAGQGDNQVVVHPADPERYRWLTICEVKRIMGLPDSYDLGDTKTAAGEIMGQGVEVGAVTQIIKSITSIQ